MHPVRDWDLYDFHWEECLWPLHSLHSWKIPSLHVCGVL